MTTLDKLRDLNDGQFHRLADAILKRVEPRFRNLRTHGVNDNGVSIKGQPDSYVGNSARSCTIAFCYTVDTGDWWNKLCRDISSALNTSPNICELVIALPRDVDREGPKDKTIDWEGRLNAAAGNKSVTIFDGRRLSALLDEKYQDLRYEHLAIPFSRLSNEVVIASCQTVNQITIDDLKTKGRFDPEHYVFRQADGQLKQLWREAFGSRKGCRLIPVVNDSGLGKTSLLCSFVDSSGGSVPILFLQARDSDFHAEDVLVRMVMQKLQGVLSQELQKQEEVALTKVIDDLGALTVVLDGLDEVRNSSNVRRALKFWFESTIGAVSVLIVSSRPDFWRRCSEGSWARWISYSNSNVRKTTETSREQTILPEKRILGYSLPERFSPDELSLAWSKFGLDPSDLAKASNDIRQELSHPFTLRAWIDIATDRSAAKLPSTRDEIIETWIWHRLEQEADTAARISKELLWAVLLQIARRINEAGESCISIDALTDIARFDPTHPPGEVVERLINAHLLEFLEEKRDFIRFVFDTVYEFFLAEADVEDIKTDIQSVVASIGKMTFSRTATRLGRIGFRIAGRRRVCNCSRQPRLCEIAC